MKKVIILIFFSLLSCSESNEKKNFLRSVEIHDSAMKISYHVEDKLHELEKVKNKKKGSFLIAIRDSLSVFKHDLADWKRNIFEVPGHEHSGHDHAVHQHETAPYLTSEMILEIQVDQRDKIEKLNDRVEQLLKTFSNLD